MEEYLNKIMAQISELVGGYIPTLLAALVVLIVGWLIAVVVSGIVGRLLHRTGADKKLTQIASRTDAQTTVKLKPGLWMSKLVFWVIMLFVLIGFFQVLGISQVTVPLNQLLTNLFDYAPLLVGAGLLLLIAWIVASLLKMLISRSLTAAKLDERLGAKVLAGDERYIPITKSISETVYWLVFLLFLPAILDALKLEGLLQPVQGMLNEILTVLPNIFAAAVVLLIGWLIARVLQKIVTNLLSSAGADQLGNKIGLSDVLKKNKLSGLIGLVVYFLVLIPVLVAAFNVLGLDAITRPTTNMLDSILAAIPSIFAAALVLAVAYIVGRVVVGLITNLLASMGFNRVLALLGIDKKQVEGTRTPAEIVGYIVMLAIMFFAAIEASQLLGFSWLGALGTQFTVFAGQVILGLIIFAAGLFLSNMVYKIVRDSGASQARVLSLASRISILVLAGAMALRQMGLANEIVNMAFGIILGSIAVAAAIAFGLGGREIASHELGKWLKSFKRE